MELSVDQKHLYFVVRDEKAFRKDHEYFLFFLIAGLVVTNMHGWAVLLQMWL